MESKIQNLKPEIQGAAPRIDLKDKVTGRAQYVEDLPDLPNTTYGAPLLSSYSHAKILSIDSAEALKMPGVLGIVDRDHLDGVNPRLKVAPHEHFKLIDDQDFVAIDKVRYDGDHVALIVAEDLHTAERALEKIRVEYEPLPSVFDAGEALAVGAPILHEERGSNLLLEDSLIWGDIDEGFYDALLRMYARAINKVLTLPEEEQHEFRERLKTIMVTSDRIGWGYHDGLCEQYCEAFPEDD